MKICLEGTPFYTPICRVKYYEFGSNNLQKAGYFAILDKNARSQPFLCNTKHLKVLESEKRIHIGPGITQLSYVEFGHLLTLFYGLFG